MKKAQCPHCMPMETFSPLHVRTYRAQWMVSVSCPNVEPTEREMKVRQQESKNVTFIATEGSWRVWSRCGSPVGYLRLHPWIELTYLIIEGAGQPHGTAEQRHAACRQAKVKEKKEEEELEHVQLLLPNWREQGEARGVRLGARTRSLFHSPKSMQRWASRPTVKISITA